MKRIVSVISAIILALGAAAFPGAAEDWSTVYEDFVMNEKYLGRARTVSGDGYTYTEEGYFTPEGPEDDYNSIAFGLCDMDRNGVPELIIRNGADSEAERTNHAYTVIDGGIAYIGSLGFRGSWLSYCPSSPYPGLFCTDGSNGEIRTEYYTFDGSGIDTAEVFVWEARGEGSDEDMFSGGEFISRTEDEALFSLAVSTGSAESLGMFTLDAIAAMGGWQAFVDACFTAETEEPSGGEDTGLGVGSSVFFGRWEQDGDTDNGPEAVEWVVLDVRGGEALLISRYILDALPYGDDADNYEWSNVIPEWLNSGFLEAAFGEEERAAVLEKEIEQTIGPDPWDPAGKTTEKVFLLSCQEAENYFPDDEARKCAPTEHAVSGGLVTDDQDAPGPCAWWLRTSYGSSGCAWCVDSDGSMVPSSTNNINGVRPALWVDTAAAGLGSGTPADESWTAVTNVRSVNVRYKPDASSGTVTQLREAGTAVTVTGEGTDRRGTLWYAVVLENGKKGYIRGDLLDRYDGELPADDAAETPAPAETPAADVTVPPRENDVPDPNVYTGGWPETYLTILYRHEDRIRENQDLVAGYDDSGDHARLFVCLYDVSGDGIPELFFVEHGLWEGAYDCGSLYVYSNNGEAAVCVIHVGDFELEADNGPGYRVFTTAEGLALQYGCGAEQSTRLFEAPGLAETENTYLMGAGGDDPAKIRCYLDGRAISLEEFRARWEAMYDRREVTLADSDGPCTDPGCLYTVDEAIGYLSSLLSAATFAPTPEPTETPRPTNRGWSETYRAFVLEKEFERDGRLAWSDGRGIWFALHDMDDDGTPEMIAYSGDDSADDGCCHVFTYQDGDIRYMGEMGRRMLQFTYSDDRTYPGLVQTYGGNGTYTTGYWYIKDGKPKEENLETLRLRQSWNGEDYTATRGTRDTALYNWYYDAPFYTLRTWAYEAIAIQGWDAFTEAVYLSPARPAATEAPATEAPAIQAPVTQGPAAQASDTGVSVTEVPATQAPVETPQPTEEPEDALYGKVIADLSTRSGPSSSYQEMGTYNLKGRTVRVLSRAQDKGGLWWVKCEIPYRDEIRVLWALYERFDRNSLPLEDIPLEP